MAATHQPPARTTGTTDTTIDEHSQKVAGTTRNATTEAELSVLDHDRGAIAAITAIATAG